MVLEAFPGKAVAVIIAFVLAFSSQTGPAASQKRPAPQVIVERAEGARLSDRVEALGTLRAYDAVEVTSKVTEMITTIHFRDSQRIAKGDILVEMSSAQEQAAVAEAEATVREAKAQLERAQPLAERGVSSDAVLSERQRDYDTARARLEAAKARLRERQIVAPFAGLTGLRRISVGALVEPGTVITTIQDDSVMKLDFSVPSTFLSSMRPGIPIEASAGAYSGRKFTGKVSAVDNSIDQDTRSITVRAELPNPDGDLKAGMLMTVELLKNTRQAVLAPEEALIMRGNQAYVYVVDPDAQAPQVEQREVILDAREPGKVEIVKGLAPGEAVITHGVVKVGPGDEVRIRAIAKGGEPLTQLLGVEKKPDT